MPSRVVIGALVFVVVVAALVSAATASFMMSALPREQESAGRSQPQWVVLHFDDQSIIIRTEDISFASRQDSRWVAIMNPPGTERPQRFLLTADTADELCQMLGCWSPSRRSTPDSN